MKRPIAQTAGDTKAVMWKADHFGQSFERLDVSRAVHRYAGAAHQLSCLPKRSAIDGNYFAEIGRYRGQGVMDINIKLGTGSDPVAAAINGYRQVVPADPMWAVFTLELEAEMLRRAVVGAAAIEAKIERALADLTAVLAMGNTEQ